MSVVSKSLPMPAAMRAMRSAVAGASSTKSAHLASSICPIEASAAGSSKLSDTGRPETACMVSGVMNSLAAWVITTCTVAPRSTNRRVNSAHLYAAIPPLIPSRIFLPANDCIWDPSKNLRAMLAQLELKVGVTTAAVHRATGRAAKHRSFHRQ